jgi:hypothetical protein
LVSPAAKKRADKRDQNERKLASSCQSRWAIGAPPCAQLELAKCTSLEPKLALTTSLAIEVAMELASLAGLWRKRADQHDRDQRKLHPNWRHRSRGQSRQSKIASLAMKAK